MSRVQIYHSSFARYSLHREVMPILAWNHGATCEWCGNVSHDHNGKARLFKYSREDDSRSDIHYVDGLFCSVSCMRTYHDVKETP